jgi:hypothetical protein
MRRTGAVVGAAALVKTGQALGLVSGLTDSAYAYRQPTCGTNAFVKFSRALTPYPDQPTARSSFGTVSLWYSATCRSVAAQLSSPEPVPDTKLVSYANIQKAGDGLHDPDPCFGDVGSNGCKTGFVDDAGIQQFATARSVDSLLNGYVGQTPPW